MNDDCTGPRCTRKIDGYSALTGYKFMTGRLLVDEETLMKAIENDDAECIAEYHAMWS